MRSRLSLAVLATAFAAGCAAEKPILERGWIGGEYETFPGPFTFETAHQESHGELPEQIAAERSAAVLVTRVFESTPAQTAGLREGDLVLELNAQPVQSSRDLLERVDAMPTGSKLKLKLYRFGETTECEVIVGRERYKIWRRFSVKLFPLLTCDLLPNPDFDVFGLLSFWTGDARLELLDPRQRASAAAGAAARTGDRWGFFLGIFGFASYREIVSQDAASGIIGA